MVVEDEPLVALEMTSFLTGAGCEVVGPAASVETGLALINESSFDVALLDANLGGQAVDPLAAALAVRQIPFAFVTGYGVEGLPEAFRDAALIGKPFAANDVLRQVEILLRESQKASRI